MHNKSGKSPNNEGGGSRIDLRPRSRLAIVVVVVALVGGAVAARDLIRDAARRQSRCVGLGLRLNLSAADRDPLTDGGYAIDRNEEHCGNTNMA